MKKHTRRQWIGGVTMAALVAPFEKLIPSGTPTVRPIAQVTDGHHLALGAARVINNAQLVHNRFVGGYASLDDLASRRVRDLYREKRESDALDQLELTSEDIVPGFRASLELTPDRQSYSLLIIEKTANDGRAFAYATDASGVIRQGTVSVGTEVSVSNTFAGSPIPKPSPQQPEGSAVSAMGMAIATFLIPTLHANCSDPQCSSPFGTCGGCFTGSASECGAFCAPLCCNVGYESCPWCCMCHAGCGCP